MKRVGHYWINSYKYNDQAGRKALHRIVEDALKNAVKTK